MRVRFTGIQELISHVIKARTNYFTVYVKVRCSSVCLIILKISSVIIFGGLYYLVLKNLRIERVLFLVTFICYLSNWFSYKWNDVENLRQ